MGSKYTYQEDVSYKSESTPITIRNFPAGKYRITATYNDGEASADYETAPGTTDIGLNIRYRYGFAAVDVAINTSDPVARCSYPQTITVNGQTVNNSCYGFTPAKSASNNFDMGSWASHKILEGIKPVISDGAATPTFTDAPKNAGTWTTGTEYFTEFPFNWLSITNDGTRIRIIFSDKPDRPDSTFQSYAFRKANGTDVANAFHLGCFGANSFASAIYSRAAMTYTTSVRYAVFCQGANARGDQYDIMSFQQWTYLQALFILLYKSTNSQTAHSYGYVDASSSNTTNAVLSTTKFGMAGSTSSARNAFFWIHDIWGNITHFIGGLFVRAGSTKTLYYLLARQSQDSSFNSGMSTAASSIATQSGIGVSTGLTSTASGDYINAVCGTNEGGFAPMATSGSESTYFADYGHVYSHSSIAEFPRVGGYYTSDQAGLFCCVVDVHSSTSHTPYGSRLAYRGGR